MGAGARREETRDEDFGMEGDEMEKENQQFYSAGAPYQTWNSTS
jgi:hypothetical protein